MTAMNQAWLFNQGKNYQSYRMLGARPSTSPEGEQGYRFAVWAPRVQAVSVVGDFNGWDSNAHHLKPTTTGIWQGFIAGVCEWQRYKYAIKRIPDESCSRLIRSHVTRNASRYRLHTYNFENDYTWEDGDYMARRQDARNAEPLNIYEVHLGAGVAMQTAMFSYRDIARQLADYLVDMDITPSSSCP